MHRSLLFTLCLFFCSSALVSQSKITIEDRQQLLSNEVKEVLKTKFNEISLDYTNLVDFTRKCDYYFASIGEENGELSFVIKDCDDKLIGRKSLGNSMLQESNEEQAIVYYFNLKSIIETPAKTSAEYFSNLEQEASAPPQRSNRDAA
jgi:hypothetical protein